MIPKPTRAKPVDHEGPVQKSILQWLEWQFPDWIIHHCKTEINKGGVAFMKEASRAKSMGAKAGFPDLLVLPWAHIGPVFLEVKAEGNTTSKPQKAMHERLRGLGYRVAVVRSIEDVQEALAGWGIASKFHGNPGA